METIIIVRFAELIERLRSARLEEWNALFAEDDRRTELQAAGERFERDSL